MSPPAKMISPKKFKKQTTIKTIESLRRSIGFSIFVFNTFFEILFKMVASIPKLSLRKEETVSIVFAYKYPYLCVYVSLLKTLYILFPLFFSLITLIAPFAI